MPVVCVRLSDEALTALEAQAARRGVDRSTWLRDTVGKALGLPRGTTAVESLSPRSPASIEPLVPGDILTVVQPGGIQP